MFLQRFLDCGLSKLVPCLQENESLGSFSNPEVLDHVWRGLFADIEFLVDLEYKDHHMRIYLHLGNIPAEQQQLTRHSPQPPKQYKEQTRPQPIHGPFNLLQNYKAAATPRQQTILRRTTTTTSTSAEHPLSVRRPSTKITRHLSTTSHPRSTSVALSTCSLSLS